MYSNFGDQPSTPSAALDSNSNQGDWTKQQEMSPANWTPNDDSMTPGPNPLGGPEYPKTPTDHFGTPNFSTLTNFLDKEGDVTSPNFSPFPTASTSLTTISDENIVQNPADYLSGSTYGADFDYVTFNEKVKKFESTDIISLVILSLVKIHDSYTNDKITDITNEILVGEKSSRAKVEKLNELTNKIEKITNKKYPRTVIVLFLLFDTQLKCHEYEHQILGFQAQNSQVSSDKIVELNKQLEQAKEKLNKLKTAFLAQENKINDFDPDSLAKSFNQAALNQSNVVPTNVPPSTFVAQSGAIQQQSLRIPGNQFSQNLLPPPLNVPLPLNVYPEYISQISRATGLNIVHLNNVAMKIKEKGYSDKDIFIIFNTMLTSKDYQTSLPQNRNQFLNDYINNLLAKIPIKPVQNSNAPQAQVPQPPTKGLAMISTPQGMNPLVPNNRVTYPSLNSMPPGTQPGLNPQPPTKGLAMISTPQGMNPLVPNNRVTYPSLNSMPPGTQPGLNPQPPTKGFGAMSGVPPRVPPLNNSMQNQQGNPAAVPLISTYPQPQLLVQTPPIAQSQVLSQPGPAVQQTSLTTQTQANSVSTTASTTSSNNTSIQEKAKKKRASTKKTNTTGGKKNESTASTETSAPIAPVVMPTSTAPTPPAPVVMPTPIAPTVMPTMPVTPTLMDAISKTLIQATNTLNTLTQVFQKQQNTYSESFITKLQFHFTPQEFANSELVKKTKEAYEVLLQQSNSPRSTNPSQNTPETESTVQQNSGPSGYDQDDEDFLEGNYSTTEADSGLVSSNTNTSVSSAPTTNAPKTKTTINQGRRHEHSRKSDKEQAVRELLFPPFVKNLAEDTKIPDGQYICIVTGTSGNSVKRTDRKIMCLKVHRDFDGQEWVTPKLFAKYFPEKQQDGRFDLSLIKEKYNYYHTLEPDDKFKDGNYWTYTRKDNTKNPNDNLSLLKILASINQMTVEEIKNSTQVRNGNLYFPYKIFAALLKAAHEESKDLTDFSKGFKPSETCFAIEKMTDLLDQKQINFAGKIPEKLNFLLRDSTVVSVESDFSKSLNRLYGNDTSSQTQTTQSNQSNSAAVSKVTQEELNFLFNDDEEELLSNKKTTKSGAEPTSNTVILSNKAFGEISTTQTSSLNNTKNTPSSEGLPQVQNQQADSSSQSSSQMESSSTEPSQAILKTVEDVSQTGGLNTSTPDEVNESSSIPSLETQTPAERPDSEQPKQPGPRNPTSAQVATFFRLPVSQPTTPHSQVGNLSQTGESSQPSQAILTSIGDPISQVSKRKETDTTIPSLESQSQEGQPSKKRIKKAKPSSNRFLGEQNLPTPPLNPGQIMEVKKEISAHGYELRKRKQGQGPQLGKK